MIKVVEADVLAVSADALVVPIDGTFRPSADQTERVLGNIGRQFLRTYPEAELLDEIEAQVDFPVPLGRAAVVELSEAPFRLAILVSILHHAGHLELAAKRAQVRASFAAALAIAEGEGVQVLASPVLQGGWRLSPEVAFAEMVLAHKASARAHPHVHVCCVDSDLADRLRGIAHSMGDR